MLKYFLTVTGLIAMTCISSAQDDGWRNKAIALIKKEKKVHDAIWSAPQSLWVSVTDDGSRRDGYAEYICLLTSDAGRPKGTSFVVTIMDHKAMLRNDIKKLGTSMCALD